MGVAGAGVYNVRTPAALVVMALMDLVCTLLSGSMQAPGTVAGTRGVADPDAVMWGGCCRQKLPGCHSVLISRPSQRGLAELLEAWHPAQVSTRR